jgi:hypothetical protein
MNSTSISTQPEPMTSKPGTKRMSLYTRRMHGKGEHVNLSWSRPRGSVIIPNVHGARKGRDLTLNVGLWRISGIGPVAIARNWEGRLNVAWAKSTFECRRKQRRKKLRSKNRILAQTGLQASEQVICQSDSRPCVARNTYLWAEQAVQLLNHTNYLCIGRQFYNLGILVFWNFGFWA